MRVDINIDLDAKCAECRKGGACQNGLCLKCTANVISGKPMKSDAGKHVAARLAERNRIARPEPRERTR